MRQRSHSKSGWWLAGGITLLVCLTVVVAFCVLQKRSLDVANYLMLEHIYNQWEAAGRPEGDRLQEFIRGSRADLVTTNIHLNVNQTNYMTQFALSEARSSSAGPLYITTNRVLLWRTKDGRFKLVER
jgi:hypothetical protein